jgi:hypothetical protein
MEQEIVMMGLGMGGFWMLVVIAVVVLGILALVKYLAK